MNKRVSVILLKGKEVMLVKLKEPDRMLPRATWVFPFVQLPEDESPRKALNDLLKSFDVSYAIRDKVFKYSPSENPKINYIVYVVDFESGEPDISSLFHTYKWVSVSDIAAFSTSFADANIAAYLNRIGSEEN
jgi:hypothetical protein